MWTLCQFLNFFYEALHLLVVFSNLLLWMFKKSRLFHFYLVNLTMFSWVGLGWWYGFGYCFLTQWHWEIKKECGESSQLPNSFISYLLNEYFHFFPKSLYVDIVTAVSFILVFSLSWVFYIRNK